MRWPCDRVDVAICFTCSYCCITSLVLCICWWRCIAGGRYQRDYPREGVQGVVDAVFLCADAVRSMYREMCCMNNTNSDFWSLETIDCAIMARRLGVLSPRCRETDNLFKRAQIRACSLVE